MIIDTDVHVVEPPDLWAERLSHKKWGDNIPRIEWVPELDREMWIMGGEPVAPCATSYVYPDVGGGVNRGDRFPHPPARFSDPDTSGSIPTERARIMDRFNIDAAVLYPNVGLTGEAVFRKAGAPVGLANEVTAAYNDWLLTWPESAPGRFIPLANIPYWDLDAAVAEIERCAENGHRGFVTTGKPELHEEPFLAHPHWNPIWEAAQATGYPVSFHAAGGGLDHLTWPERVEIEGRTRSLIRISVASFLENGVALCDLLMSGILERHPELNFVIVESGLGWVPFLLEALDVHASHYDPDAFTFLPSELFRRQVSVNTWFENINDEIVERVGPDNVLFETDYPHPTCLIEDEVSEAVSRFNQLRPEYRDKILWQNAVRLHRLDPTTINPPR